MAFTVEDVRDLVRLLGEHPEWREEVRRLVLTEDVLGLPGVVRELADAQRRTEAAVRELTESQRRTEAVVRELTEAQRRTEARVEEVAEAQRRSEDAIQRLDTTQQGMLVTQQDILATHERKQVTQEHMQATQERMLQEQATLRDQLSTLRGEALERRYRDHPGAFFGPIWRRIRVVRSHELDEIVDRGVEDGALDDEAALDLRRADLILRGRRPGEESETYLVVEVSIGVGPSDVDQAVRRASVLRRLRPTLTAVAGERMTPEARQVASAAGVWQILNGSTVAPDGPLPDST